jgi:hypothetical protein
MGGYVGFVDPSGGRSDSMTMAVAHAEGDRVLLDAIRETRAPFVPAEVVTAFAATLRSYKIARSMGTVTARNGSPMPSGARASSIGRASTRRAKFIWRRCRG